jgi:hypothetical protein
MSLIVGFFGGLIYNGAIAHVIKSEKIPFNKKEVCLSICILSQASGIVSSSLIGVGFDLLMGE